MNIVIAQHHPQGKAERKLQRMTTAAKQTMTPQTIRKSPVQPSDDNNQSLLHNGNMDPGRSGGYLSYVTGFISRMSTGRLRAAGFRKLTSGYPG